MSQWAYAVEWDKKGLVNLHQMEWIGVQPIEEEDTTYPNGCTHIIFASNITGQGYALFAGTEEACLSALGAFIDTLGVDL